MQFPMRRLILIRACVCGIALNRTATVPCATPDSLARKVHIGLLAWRLQPANCRSHRESKMWIVKLALRRPYTFVVLAILILIMGTLAALRTPTDIFANINIPVVSIIWNYTGLAPHDISSRIITLQQ